MFGGLGKMSGGDQKARGLVKSGATLLDVRTREEHAGGHIDGSQNIPVQELAERLGEIDRSRPVVVYCAAGGRSARAAAMLRAAGFSHVHDLGAIHAW